MNSQKCWWLKGLGLLWAVSVLLSGPAHAVPLASPKVGAGGTHSCAVVDGGVRCWGSNDYGELGAPTFGDVDTATDVRTLEPGTNAGVTSVVVGEHHSCAIVNGGMKCWGRNNFGQLGVGDTDDRRQPVAVPNITNAIFIAAGDGHTCAIYSDASVTKGLKCWGDNSSGQLGLGDLSGGHTSPPSQFTLTDMNSVSAGGAHSCAVANSGVAVWCWGSNDHGQLGIGQVGCEDADCTVPNLVPNLSLNQKLQVSAGNAHTCVVINLQNLLYCWGANDHAQLGLGPDSACDEPSPKLLPNFGVSSVSAGEDFTCAVIDNYPNCWGAGDRGQQGNATTQQASQPHQVVNFPITPGGMPAPETSAGSGHACALFYNGDAYCWGDKHHGMLGDGKEGRVRAPQFVSGLNSVQKMSAGREHNCALSTNGKVSCWGRNNFGQIGDGTTTDALGPQEIFASGASAVAVGDAHSCAIVGDTVRCWGRNQWGQLGRGDNVDSPTPSLLPQLTGATAIALGSLHGCAIYSDATVTNGVKCWGRNTSGELGLGDYPPCLQNVICLDPAAIPNLSGVKAISAGDSYTCVISSADAVECWGRNNYGQLGQLDQSNRNEPTLVPNLSGVTAIATGDGHACAIYTSGGVVGGMKCWGRNYYGELGLGDSATCGNAEPFLCLGPMAIPGWAGGVRVAVGGYHTCAIRSFFGMVACWGWGEEGQLGSKWLDDWNTPNNVVIPTGAVTISAGSEHACATLGNGTANCWGKERYGRLGAFASGLVTAADKVIVNDVIFANRFEIKL